MRFFGKGKDVEGTKIFITALNKNRLGVSFYVTLHGGISLVMLSVFLCVYSEMSERWLRAKANPLKANLMGRANQQLCHAGVFYTWSFMFLMLFLM